MGSVSAAIGNLAVRLKHDARWRKMCDLEVVHNIDFQVLREKITNVQDLAFWQKQTMLSSS